MAFANWREMAISPPLWGNIKALKMTGQQSEL
jgi:hypothetical protein